jgi:hypothetical protein
MTNAPRPGWTVARHQPWIIWWAVPDAVASVRAVHDGAATVFVTPSLVAQSLPDWLNDSLFRWITNNGLATVFVILILAIIVAPLLALLRYVIFDAVAHFNKRLDLSTVELSAGFRQMASTIEHLDETLDKLANQSAANHEALTNVMLFMSRTQTDVILTKEALREHRDVVEPATSIPQRRHSDPGHWPPEPQGVAVEEGENE